MPISNPFNPIRFGDGPASGEDVNRVEDRIRTAFNEIINAISRTFVPFGPLVPPGTPAAPANARYWLSQANAGLPFAVDMGALGTGVLQQVVTSGISAPAAVAVPQHALLFGGATGLLDYDVANFYVDKSAVSVGIGGAPPSGTGIAVTKNVNARVENFVSNINGGASAFCGYLAQTGSAAPGTPPYVALQIFGSGYVPSADATLWVPNSATIAYAGEQHFIIDLASALPPATESPYFGVTVRAGSPFAVQTLAFEVGYLGNVYVPISLGAGGIVWADSASTPAGQLKLVTIGSGLSFVAGTLTATGSGGTVTNVTGTAPIVITGSPTTTPNVTIQGAIVSGSTSTAAQNLGALTTGLLKGTVSAGVSTISRAVPNSDYVDISRILFATAPIQIDGTTSGDLGSNRTFSILDFVGSGASHARGIVPDPPAVAGTTKFLREDATWAVPPDTDTGITQLTGDVTAGPGSGSQAATIANNAVTNAKLRDSAALSVIGRPGGSSGDPSDIVAANNGDVLWMNGGGIGFAPYPQTVNLTWDVSLAADALIGTSGELIPVGYILALDSQSHTYRLGAGRAKCRLELIQYTNSFTGGGTWSLEIYKNGATCGVVLGPYSSGSTTIGDTGDVTISGADGDVYSLIYIVSGTINTAASSIKFSANATFSTV